jgi:hypothetical protein
MSKVGTDEARRQLIDAALEFCFEIRNRPIVADVASLPDLQRAAMDYLEAGDNE